MQIVAIIPARGGSKGIPMKNIVPLHGVPLIVWSIRIALESTLINRVVVSTDCKKIAKIAREAGAEVPFIRPAAFAQDLSTDYEFLKHYLDWSPHPLGATLLVQLRPTYPKRTVAVVDDCIRTMLENLENYDSLRTVIPFSKSPFKMYTVETETEATETKAAETKILKPLFQEWKDLREPYNLPRQVLPQTYLHNGYLDIIKSETILQSGSVTGERIYPYITDKRNWHYIDYPEDLQNCADSDNMESPGGRM